MRVLVANHTSAVGGSELSLLGVLAGLPEDVSVLVACPSGPLEERVRALGLPVARLAGTSASLRLHPLHSPRGIGEVGLSAAQLGRAARRFKADLIHAGSLRTGLMAAPAARGLKVPLVVEVKECLPATALSKLSHRVLDWGATVVNTASDHVSRHLTELGVRAPKRAVFDSIDLARFDPAVADRVESRRRLGLPPSAPVIGLVAQITPWKGQDTAIRALHSLRRHRPDARLLLVGETKFVEGATRFDNRTYLEGLHGLVDELGLNGSVQFLGQRADVPEIVAALDALLLPSRDEPFGRIVAEAMAMEVPVVVTDRGGPAGYVSEAGAGLLAPADEPERWSEAVARVLDDPSFAHELGRRGRAAVERFSADAYVRRTLSSYREALAAPRARSGG